MNPVLCEKTRVPLWVDADDPIVSQHLLQVGEWDPPIADLLEEALKPDDVFLDLGAHVGYFSMVAARKCKRVIAVEPQAELCDLLRRNGVENIEVKQTAIGRWRGRAALSVPVNRGAASFNHHDGVEEWVEVCKLSDVSDGVTVAKLDLEGDEPDILAANDEFLDNLRLVIFEYHAGHDDYWHQIEDAGFHIFGLEPVELQSEPPVLPDGFYTNLVGVRE